MDLVALPWHCRNGWFLVGIATGKHVGECACRRVTLRGRTQANTSTSHQEAFMSASSSLVDKVNLIRAQLGLSADAPIPHVVTAAAAALEVNMEGLSMPQQVALCYEALFGVQQPVDVPAAFKIPSPRRDASASPITMTSSPAPMAVLRAPCNTNGPSKAHCCPSSSALRAFLDELTDGAAVAHYMLALLDHRGSSSFDACNPSEWYAEHACVQLVEASGCDTKPAWVAWMVDEAPEPGESPVRQVCLWAADGKAARRALLALELQRSGLSVEMRAGPGGCASAGYAAQVHRWAYERETYDVLPAIEHTWPGASIEGERPFEITLRAATGAALEGLQRERAACADTDLALARRQLEALSKALLEKDPNATMTVGPGERPGSYTLHNLRFKGHNMEFAIDIDRCSDVDDLVKVATTSCLCCASGADNVGLGDALS